MFSVNSMAPKPRKPLHQRPAWSILLFDLSFFPWLRTLSAPFIARRPWAALCVGLLTHPIVAMFYLGRWKRALLYAILSPLAIALEIVLLLHVSDFPKPPFFLLEAIGLRVIGAVDAYFLSRSWHMPDTPRFYTKWYNALGLWIGLIFLLFGGYTVFRWQVAEVFSATKDIDAPNITKGDFFVLWKTAERFSPGDIVLWEQEMYGYPRSFFWRVIAQPGDKVEIQDSQIIINGEDVKTTHLGEGIAEETLSNGRSYRVYSTEKITMPLVTVPEAHYFLLSDNRDMYKVTDFFASPQFIALKHFMGKVVFICKYPCPLEGKT